MLHLATQFGAAAVWPAGFEAAPHWGALVGAVAAYVALTRWKIDVPWVVLGGGAMGFAAAVFG